MANERFDAQGWELTPESDLYPKQLLGMESPPPIIYGRGDPELLSTMCLGVVGARLATPYGLAVAEMAGRIAAESGITVVSGGARGCDASAARGALGAGGNTIVVAGTGADQVYPLRSRDVFEAAWSGRGAVISIEPWGTPPQPWAFPKRNVVIAGLSTAVLVCEAGQRSGTTSTALAAIELGREVYAAPGSIYSPESTGANELIRDGAHIVCSESDLEMLISQDFGVLRLVREEIATPKGRLLSALTANPMRPDDLANYLGLDPIETVRILSDHEVAGLVTRMPDRRYAPTQDVLLGRARIGGQYEA